MGTLLRDRLDFLRLLQADGVIFVSIDKLERTVLEGALDAVFGRENRVEELISDAKHCEQPTTYLFDESRVCGGLMRESLRTVEESARNVSRAEARLLGNYGVSSPSLKRRSTPA